MATAPPPEGYCLLDANIWIGNPLLNTPVAAALRFVLRNRRYSIAVPEVVEEEVIKTLIEHAHQHTQRIKDGFDGSPSLWASVTTIGSQQGTK